MSAPLDDRAAAQLRGTAAGLGLEYRDAAAVSIDPRALSLLAPRECRRLRAVPLEATSAGAVVGVDAPSEERFEAVRAQTGPNTRFVLLDDRTVDALLSSRLFAESASAPPPPTAPPTGEPPAVESAPADPPEEPPLHRQPPAEPSPVEVAPSPPPAEPAAQVPVPRDAEPPPAPELAPVDVPPAETTGRPAAEPIATAPEPAATPAQPARSGADDELLARIDAAVSAWSDIRAAVRALGDELEASRRHLRETKEQLAVARAQSDQDQLRIHGLEVELEQGRGIVAAARRRLIDAADALSDEVPAPPLHLPDHD